MSQSVSSEFCKHDDEGGDGNPAGVQRKNNLNRDSKEN